MNKKGLKFRKVKIKICYTVHMFRLNKLNNTIYLFCIYLSIFGTTLFFSTSTRSVFEVNKLGIFKIAMAIGALLFFYDQLIGNKQWFYSFNKNRWFNYSIILVWFSNILSNFFKILKSAFGEAMIVGKGY